MGDEPKTVTVLSNLPHFPSFDVETDKSNSGTRWEKWVSRLENLFVGLNITEELQKRALLLHYAGEKVFDIYDAEKGTDDGTTYAGTKGVLDTYFAPKKNTQMEVYTFRSHKQSDDQTLDEFVTELRTLAKNCKFDNVDKEILQQVIQNCRSNQLRRRALREPGKGLADILTLGRMLEQSEKQASVMETERNVHAVSRGRGKSRGRGRSNTGQGTHRSGRSRGGHTVAAKPKSRDDTAAICRNCGYGFPHRTAPCPARGKTCNLCHRMNHFARCCWNRGKKVHELSEQDQQFSSEDEFNYSITVKSVGKANTPKTEIKLDNVKVKATIDTGSSVNIIDEAAYKAIGKPRLQTKRLPKLLPYGGGPNLRVCGCCELTIEKNKKIMVEKFFLVKGNYGTLLGYKTAMELEVVKVVQQTNEANTLETKYPNIYNGIGKLKGQKVTLHINKDVKPVAQKTRRTPFHMRAKVEKEIKKLIKDDIIEEVQNESTPWVSPIVTPPKKNGDVRICVDMREANKAIERERHPMPTIDELIHDLNGATVFSKLDLSSGYNQLVLDEESRPITTFTTHLGLFRYKRLNFGTNSASEVFQKTISEVIRGIDGAKNISDDILVYAKTTKEHDIALDKVFKALHKSGLTLNRAKCEFNKTEVTFFGVVFRASGISPDPVKVEAIQTVTEPTNVSELRSFLGMTGYCSRFISGYATITEPLRKLTGKNVKWKWDTHEQEAFDRLKTELTSDTVITYYDPKRDTELITDASPVGLSGILTQEGKVVAYASRALTDTETRYSQTEREALAIVWACEHYAMYLKGAPKFTVVTDHKPLTTIWKKKQPPLRIERWGLRLQPFKLQIEYRPGKNNPSDYMSRHPMKIKQETRNLAEEYVAYVCEESVPNAMTMDEIKCASVSDMTIQKAVEFTKTGRWFELKTLQDSEDINLDELSSLRSVKGELTVYCDTVLMRNDRIVLPKSLRAKAIKLGHEGHQGLTRTKSFIRSKVWFPNLNAEIEKAIQGCIACQANTREAKPREPLRMSEMPSGPWQNLSADFCGPLDTGEYLLVITDEYSRYPVVEIVKSVSANSVIPVLDKVLAMFGIPVVIKSDNGSPFNSAQFKKYAKLMGFVHRKVTPLWPRANAQAEAFNKPLMKCIRSARVEEKNWKQEMHKFLRQYRATPHTVTGYSPFRLMFRREARTRLPEAVSSNEDRVADEIARSNDEKSKTYSKAFQDKQNHAEEKKISVGDKVLLRTENKTKMAPCYRPVPYEVIAKRGPMVTVKQGDHRVTRNSSHMKKVNDDLITSASKDMHEGQNLLDEAFEDTALESSTGTTDTGQNVQSYERPRRERRAPKYLDDYVWKKV